MMNRVLAVAALVVVLLLPSLAGAFSFGTFAPGEQILDIQISAGGGDFVTFDTATNTLVIQASVSRIDTNFATYTPILGTVLLDSQLTLVGGTELVLAPTAIPPFGGLIAAQFSNGGGADLTIIDVGIGGSGLLLAADYSANLAFSASSPGGVGQPITGSIGGDFAVLTGIGDNIFETAFGSDGNYFANLSNFSSNGTPVTTDLCVLITPLCLTGFFIDDFDVPPTGTIVPLPETGTVLLLAAPLALLARLRRKR